MAAPLKVLIEKFVDNESFQYIDALPNSYSIIAVVLRAALNGDERDIQPLYSRICDSPDQEVSTLARSPYVLLNTLLAVSIAHERFAVIKQILTIDPSPKPDLKRFLCRPDAAFSSKLTSIPNPAIRSLMVQHGYQKSDRPEVELDQPLYDALLGSGDLDAISTLLDKGSRPKMAHLRLALKLKPLSVLELLLGYYPAEELKDCRLLHDSVAEGKLGKVRYLIDVIKLDIDIFPTERAAQESGFSNPHGDRMGAPNGTPLHEAVRHDRKLILEVLLEKGARTDIRDEDGETPYEVARKRKVKEIIACFPEHNRQSTTFSGLRGIFGRRQN